MTFSNLDHYTAEVVSNLELRFGPPSTNEKQDFINRRAIEYDMSVERTLIYEFEQMFHNIWMRKDRENIFELLLLITTGEKVECQNVTLGAYILNKTLYPKIVIHGDYLDIVNLSGRIWINDEIINSVGKELDENFDYEYVEFLRIKQ